MDIKEGIAPNDENVTVMLYLRNSDNTYSPIGIMSLAEAKRCVLRSTRPNSLRIISL